LYEKINQELAENPVLEEGPRQSGDAGGGIDPTSGVDQNLNGDESNFSRDDERQINFSDATDSGSINNEDKDRKKKYLEGIIAQEESLAEHLMSQARIAARAEDELDIFQTIITSLDHNGFLESGFQLPSQGGASPGEQAERILSSVQLFEPVGCAVTCVRDSLIIQCRYHHPEDPLLVRILTGYFEEFERLNYRKISRSLNLPESLIMEKSRIIHNLNPYPGRQYSHGATRYIIPDVEVTLVDGEIIVGLNDDWLPNLRINSYYIQLLKKKNIEKNSQNYIQDKIKLARMFMKNIAGRRETIMEIVRSIMERQREFLKRGPGHLKPLTHREIAEEVRMHESTVSRVTSNKYVQTSWGVYDLKRFFVSRIKAGNADRHTSSDKVMRLMRDILEREDPLNPRSDEDIVAILAKAGVKVARRTVAKYRDILHVPSSHIRKKINFIKSEEKT
jgi:RNA polymerase sigma-54 factor